MSDVLLSLGFFCVLVGVALGWHHFRWHFLFKRRARREVRVIAQALRKYVERYDRIPVIDPTRDEQPARSVITILSGAECASEDAGMPAMPATTGLNPDGVDFMGQQIGRAGSDDPWGRDYHIAFCRNLEAETVISCQDEETFATASPIQIRTLSKREVTVTVNRCFAVWSSGPDKRNECGYGDDVCSWM